MPTTLSIEEQLKVYFSVKDIPDMYQKVVTSGAIDIPRIKFHLAKEEFKTLNKDTLIVKEHAILLSKRQEPVLIVGETGTGKELIARILHGDRKGEFVAVNTCAVTDTLFESELFGHVRGSFTGADRDRDGLIKQTESIHGDQGTLFLDEIGDIPMGLQSKLLRVLQNRVYRRVGSNKEEPVRCRVIAATNQDVLLLIKEGKFRLDLYERLNVFRLDIKPLRDRVEDIKLHWPSCPELVLGNPLRGNVRQLLNMKLRHEVFGQV